MKDFIYTITQVREMQARPYERQIGIMQAKIIEAINATKGRIAVSYSGGKDSGLLLYMVAQIWAEIYKDVPLTVVFANTGCEFKSMWGHVNKFVLWLEQKFGITIDLKTTSAKQPFAKTVNRFGYPFPSKKIARMVSDVRAQMRKLNVSYANIKQLVHGGLTAANTMRELGFSHVAVCDVTGIKSDNQPGTCVIPIRWSPLLGASFEVTNVCCQIHKKGPIKDIERELGDLQPMIREMADNSATRMDAYRRTGCNMFVNGKGVSKPMGPLAEQTVNRFYYETKLLLAPPYGDVIKVGDRYMYSGEQNTGCKLCGFGIMYDWGRFDRLAKLEPETVEWAFRPVENGGLGYGEVCKYINDECKGKIVMPNP